MSLRFRGPIGISGVGCCLESKNGKDVVRVSKASHTPEREDPFFSSHYIAVR